jgi:putative flavoprotein involved in K+ transport
VVPYSDEMASGRSVSTVIIGGGHSGLAMSKRLTDRDIDHVVLERGDVAHSWVTQRWDSFTLLTPNWQTRLPGSIYEGDDPDGFMAGNEIAAFLQRCASNVDAPVHAQTSVSAVKPSTDGYEVLTDQGTWKCRSVVLASGACNLPSTPSFAGALPDNVLAVNPLEYRRADDLPEGGVLVVGAAATGIQLADEIHASGRPVTLSVGEHVRMPRTYRGRDIQHWMEAIGRLDERYDEVPELLKARGVASPQLVGTRERRTLDLNALTDAGVRLCGRLGAIRDGVALFSGGLRNNCALADQKLSRLLDEIDEWIESHDGGDRLDPPERLEPTRVPPNTALTLDLRGGEINTVVWATGFRPDLSWVELPVFDGSGRLRHDGGVVDAPGVYFLGGTFLRRRRSSFIHGAEADTADLAEHLGGYLSGAR